MLLNANICMQICNQKLLLAVNFFFRAYDAKGFIVLCDLLCDLANENIEYFKNFHNHF